MKRQATHNWGWKTEPPRRTEKPVIVLEWSETSSVGQDLIDKHAKIWASVCPSTTFGWDAFILDDPDHHNFANKQSALDWAKQTIEMKIVKQQAIDIIGSTDWNSYTLKA